jgi:HEAT repeat protein
MVRSKSLSYNGIRGLLFAFLLVSVPLPGEEQGPNNRLEEFLRMAKSEVAKERSRALRCLAGFESDRAIDALLVGCQDQDCNVRAAALDSLKTSRNPKGVKVAIVCLADDEDIVRVAAVRLLGAHETDEAVSAVIKACDDKDYDVRRFAVRSLRQIGDRRGFDIARRMLSDIHPAVQSEASETVSALAPDKEKEAVWLEIYRNAKDDHVRPVALRQCARVNVQSVAKDVRAAGKSNLSQMRSVAAEGLARLGTAEDIETLHALAVDKEAMVRLEVVDACCRLQSQDARSRILESLVVDANDAVRRRTLEFLLKATPPETASLLLKILRQEKVLSLRWFAASSIGRFGNADIVPELKGLLEKEEVEKIRSALLKSISALEGKEPTQVPP